MITVVGEILVDLIEDRPGHTVAYPGGSPANVAVALARLGGEVHLLTQLGDDVNGRLLLDHLRDNGVDLAPGSLLDCARTSSARTSLSPDGEASYTFDIVWQHVSAPATHPAATCVHTGSLAALLSPGADDVAALVRAIRQTSMISFDPNLRPAMIEDVRTARDRVEVMIAASDIVKVSSDDLAFLHPRRSYRDVAREWLGMGAGLVVVTRAGDGAWACTGRGERTVDAHPVDVVDTVGAGDAFTAGLLWALGQSDLLGPNRREALSAIDDATLTEVLTFASRVAAITCGRRGADPPTKADLIGTQA